MIGKKFKTRNCGYVTVLRHVETGKLLVQFNDGTKVTVFKGNLIRGEVKNPNMPAISRVGFIGVGKYNLSDKETLRIYHVWRMMLRRCYDAKTQERNPTYIGCSVAKRWHCFQNFAADYEQMIGYGNIGWHLDKDILKRGNKVYSKRTCCLVPQNINKVLTSNNINRGNLPIGVRLGRHGLYVAVCCIKEKQVKLGRFSSKVAAFNVYKLEKEKELKRIAKQYKTQIDPKVYLTLFNYKVKITD